MFKAEGYDLVSNFLDSDYGQAIDYSNFGTASDMLSSNSYTGGTNLLPSSLVVTAGSLNVAYGMGLGAAGSGNNSINIVSPALGIGGGDGYQLVNDCDKISLSGEFEYNGVDEINNAQIVAYIFRPSQGAIVYDTFDIGDTIGLLDEGTNYFNTEIEETFLANDEISIVVYLNFKSAGTVDLTNALLKCNYFNISNDNIQLTDSVWVGDFIGEETQLDFLKGVLNDLNLVLDVEEETVYIELQDEGIEPVGTSPAILPSITTSQFDLTDIVSHETKTDLEYLQADLIHLKQTINETPFVNSISILRYQEWGSFYYSLNSFNNNKVDEFKSFFTAYYDGSSFKEKLNSNLTPPGDYSETWENNLSCRYKYQDAGFDGKSTYTYTNANASTTSVNVFDNWSLPVTFSKTWDKLFINTLNQKKNNKIIEVIFRDELGTIVSNRKEYIYKDQVYKIVEWSYDIIKKLVKAKLIMK